MSEALRTLCPLCYALAGDPCFEMRMGLDRDGLSVLTRSLRMRVKPHAARVREAERGEKEGRK